MLLNYFKASGFKVFGKQVEFSMVPKIKNYRNLAENVIVSENNKKKNLKSSLFYGGNNTGKSSFLDALFTFKGIVRKGDLLDFPFDLFENFCYKNDGIAFEISFCDGKSDIVYGIEFKNAKAIGEYIFYDDDLLFSRDLTGSLEGKLYDENQRFKDAISNLKSEKLVLTYINSFIENPGTDIFEKIKRFFGKITYLNDMEKNVVISKKIFEFAADPVRMKILNDLIQSTEMFVESREFMDDEYVLKNEIYNNHIDKNYLERMRVVKNQLDGLKMVSNYRDCEGNIVKKPSIFFDSVGTNKFIVLSMYVINALLDKKILLIDELDSSLHYKLTRALVILMNSEANVESQFIMSTHDVKLLNSNLFRKDQINFFIRDNEAVTVVSLDEFKANSLKDVRSDSNYEKMYTEEKIVVLPQTNVSDVIREISAICRKMT